MLRKTVIAATTVAMLATAVPAQSQQINMGTLLGAGVGGFAGSNIGSGKGQLAATAIGTLLGAFLGGQIGQQFSRGQPQYAQPQYAQPQVTYEQQRYPMAAVYPQQQGQLHVQRQIQQQAPVGRQQCPYVREYQIPVIIGNQTYPAYVLACSIDGGRTWQLGPASPRY